MAKEKKCPKCGEEMKLRAFKRTGFVPDDRWECHNKKCGYVEIIEPAPKKEKAASTK